MRGRTSHQANEVVVLLSRKGAKIIIILLLYIIIYVLCHEVADQLRIRFASCVEAKTDLDYLILQVPVNGLGTTDDLSGTTFFQKIFCQ